MSYVYGPPLSPMRPSDDPCPSRRLRGRYLPGAMLMIMAVVKWEFCNSVVSQSRVILENSSQIDQWYTRPKSTRYLVRISCFILFFIHTIAQTTPPEGMTQGMTSSIR